MLETAKADRPMIYCDACELQVFSRGPKSAARIAEGVRPVDDDGPAPGQNAPAPGQNAPAPAKSTATAPKRGGILDGF